MPLAPLTSRLGAAAGRYSGSWRGVVVVRAKIDRVFVDVLEQHFGELCQARFGVAHGRRRIAVDRAEVALAVDQHVAHAERLRHANQRVVERLVAMGVVVAHHLADDLGRFAVAAVGAQPGLEHAVENAPLHRLEAVANVRQRPTDDHAHGVIEVGLFHFDFNVDRQQPAGVAVAAKRYLLRVLRVIGQRGVPPA